MALTVSELQVTWDTGNDSDSAAANTGVTSDEMSPDPTCFQAKIQLKADHSGTPDTDSIVDFYLLESLGDPDGAGAGEYVTTDHAQHLATLDLNDEDPAQAVVWLPAPFENFKIYAYNDDDADAVTVSATMLEHRSS